MLVSLSQAVGDYLLNVFFLEPNWWVLLGYAGQSLFAMRFIVQWLASERVGRSVMPVAFWFFSMGGGTLILVYALYKRDPVFIIGQGFGLFVYLRNLHFVFRERRAALVS
ncbi:MAG TPA: lipid-A-disaccharide synthase N-terminal domain-containing protein [Xanthobacteraceae bacterium]|nr:lipid-A-disaccharide synthase N-terminal domain-containing protein [Xanthobacteraceae bacterium]